MISKVFVHWLRSKPWTYKSKFILSFCFFSFILYPIFSCLLFVRFCRRRIEGIWPSLERMDILRGDGPPYRSLRWTSSEGLNVGTVPSFKMHNLGTVPTFKMCNIGTVPALKMQNVGTHNIGTRLSYATLEPLIEDDLWWKTVYEGRQPLMEDYLYGRRPLIEDNLWWKTTFNGRQPLMEDDLWWKTTFDERQPLMEDDLWWKTFDRSFT